MILRIFDRDEAAELLRRKPLDEFPARAEMQTRTLATFGGDLREDEVVRRLLRDVRNFEGCLSHSWLPLQVRVQRDHRTGQ